MLNRRQFIQGTGALTATSLLGMPQFSQAQAKVDGKPSKLLLIMMNGGYAPMMTSAESFKDNTKAQMSFGLSANESNPMAFAKFGDISYDLESWGELSKSALDRMGCIGTVGASNHNSAHHFWKSPEGGLAQALASKMGGNAAIKAARVGGVIGANDGTNVGGVALEPVSSLESALATLNGAGDVITKTQRPIVGKVIDRTLERFSSQGYQNRENLGSLIDGYKGLSASMKTPAAEVNAAELNSAYSGIRDQFDLGNKLKVAEGLMRSGVNVVCVGAGGGTFWDHHDDNQGMRTRAAFKDMVPALNKFCDRMLGRDDLNVSVVFVAEHSRIPLISNHGPHLSTIVFSDNIKAGASTGITDNGGLITDADSDKPIKAWKAAIGEMVGLYNGDNPWGTAPQHRALWKHSVG